MKKTLSLVLALVLCLSVFSALAADTEVIITGTNGPGDTQS
jgi:putative cell wall-binding protein